MTRSLPFSRNLATQATTTQDGSSSNNTPQSSGSIVQRLSAMKSIVERTAYVMLYRSADFSSVLHIDSSTAATKPAADSESVISSPQVTEPSQQHRVHGIAQRLEEMKSVAKRAPRSVYSSSLWHYLIFLHLDWRHQAVRWSVPFQRPAPTLKVTVETAVSYLRRESQRLLPRRTLSKLTLIYSRGPNLIRQIESLRRNMEVRRVSRLRRRLLSM